MQAIEENTADEAGKYQRAKAQVETTIVAAEDGTRRALSQDRIPFAVRSSYVDSHRTDFYPHRGGASYRRAFPPLHTQPIGKTQDPSPFSIILSRKVKVDCEL